MSKEKDNIKIKMLYYNNKKSFGRYIVLLSNNEIWSLGKISMEDMRLLGKIGNDKLGYIKSMKEVPEKGEKLTLKNTPKMIKVWITAYNDYMHKKKEEDVK